jgi:hypothetical protein
MNLFELIQQLTLHSTDPKAIIKVLDTNGQYCDLASVADIEGGNIGLFLSKTNNGKMADDGVQVVGPPSGHKKIKCHNCLVMLQYAPKDVKSYSGTDYGGGPDGHEYIFCSLCKAKVIIKSW